MSLTTHLNYNKIYKILSDIGLDYSGQDSFRCECPIHGGGGNNFSYKNGRWKCWSHNCHEIHGDDIIGLWAAFNDNDREWAKNSVGDITIEKQIGRQKHKERRQVVYPDSILENTIFQSEYFESRGFSQSTIEHFEAFDCFNPNSNFYKRAVITVRNDESKIVGFTGRSILPSKIKWYHGKGMPKNRILYNINNIPTGTTTISIMEGPLDVWRFYEAGINNAVCALGTSISKFQAELLAHRKVKNLVFLLDPDFAGSKSTACEHGMLKNLDGFNVFSLRHLLVKDVGDTSVFDIIRKIKPELERIGG